MFLSKKWQKESLIACLGLAIIACSGQNSALAQDLTIAVQKLPDNLDPATENSDVNLRNMHLFYDTLIKIDYRNHGKLVPGLATEWKVIDAKTIEFKLRPGVVFHNGDTFDAQDVVATFSSVRKGEDKTVPVDAIPFLGGIDHVEVIDKLTVRIHMKHDDAIALNRFSIYPSQIISETALKSAKSYQDFTALDAWSGPYRLDKLEVGKKLVLKRFDKYWGENKAAADTVTLSVVPEQLTRIAGLLSGQFDIITGIGTDDFAQIEANQNAGVVGGPVANIRALVYDSTGSILANPDLRHALNVAIDRQALVDTLYAGKVEVPHGWQMSNFADMYLDRPIPEYNPEKAKELMKKAGYKGEEIEYRLVKGYYTKQLEAAQILQSMWQAVGLNVQLKVKENWDQVDKDDAGRAIEDASFSAYYPDPMGQYWRRFGPNGDYFKGGFYEIKPEMLKLGEELATSVDIKRRREIFAEMLDRFEQDPNGAVINVKGEFMGFRKDRFDFTPLPCESIDLTTDSVKFK